MTASDGIPETKEYVITVSVRENDADGTMKTEYDLLRYSWREDGSTPWLQPTTQNYDLTNPKKHSRRYWSRITLALDHLAQRSIEHCVKHNVSPPGKAIYR